ncbi:BTB-domain-containing protein [Gigaspora margarita]|uniref:BTB-domain-containing protein n=1 Tax=Gigaspora margarita TaxID=4874 RepID=A0A8H4B063_GIGMA|nr:BTB-domain-containing protein [Gigaspora margarita]
MHKFYTYGGIVVLEKHDLSLIFELMLIASEFVLDELAENLQSHLIEKEAHWLHLHFNYFFTLQESALVSLISQDDLQIKEVKIWNYFIKWGIKQNSGLSNKNFIALKNTLQNWLPHIRYLQRFLQSARINKKIKN